MGHNVKNRKSNLNVYWLPKKFSENTEEFRANVLNPHFVLPCREQGFTIIQKGWEPTELAIVFICQRGQYLHTNEDPNQPKNKKVKNRVSTTARPVAGMHARCPFRFTVGWNESCCRWFIPFKQKGNPNHCGHLQKAPEIVRTLMKNTPINEQEIARDILQQNGSLVATQGVMLQRTGINVSKDQLKHFRRQQKALRNEAKLSRMIDDGRLGFDENSIPTPADKLILSLESDTTKSYVALYGVHDSDLITIRQRSQSRSADAILSTIDNDELMDENGDGATSHSQKIRDSLSITGSDLILLGVIWTDDQSSNRFGMFPEAIACDLTEKMNSEERSCMVIAGKDSNNQVFSHTWGFLPSAANWALDWALRRGFCILHPKVHLSKVEILLTDQDGQLCNAVYNVVGPGKSVIDYQGFQSLQWTAATIKWQPNIKV